MEKIATYKDLHVYRGAMDAAMDIFRITKGFPSEERYSLIDQVRRSSRSVCANISESWRKRRYKAAFISKLSDAETEASETQVWLEFANKSGYLSTEDMARLDDQYDHITGQLIRMIESVDKWIITPRASSC